jgi:hypothetical protein
MVRVARVSFRPALPMSLTVFSAVAVFLLALHAWAAPPGGRGYAIAPDGALDIANAPAPLYRDPIHDGAADPSIVWVESEKAWLMYYTNRRANVLTAGVSWAYGTQIGIAKSTDGGRNWEYLGVCQGLGRGRQAETFWAPHVFLHDGTFHMIVTYIPRIGGNGHWGGKGQLAHYTSRDGENWTDLGFVDVGSDNIIDPAVVRLDDGRWLLVFRDDNAGVKTARCVSEDLRTWKRLEGVTGDRAHEGPVIFQWRGKYWLLCDEWRGLGVYVSDDGIDYTHHNVILNTPGKRREDNVNGAHPGVAVVGDRAFVFYFTHPGRVPGVPAESSPGTSTYEHNRSSIQVAELEIIDGKLTVDRDKHAK